MVEGILTCVRAARLQVLITWGLCSFLSVSAQRSVEIVDSEEGFPIPGVHVYHVADSVIIAADVAGRCNIPPHWFNDSDSTLIAFSAVGYGEKTRWLENREGSVSIRLNPSVEQLDQFVVTGQYRESDPRAAVHTVRVISAEEISAMAARDVADVLSGEFGVRLNQDNILGSSISMQGLSGENVKILVDGVPVIGRLNGNVDLSQLNLNGVQRIEVVEGPLSVNYGTNALAGTINIITRDTVGRKGGASAFAYLEHIGRFDVGATYNSAGKHSSWSVDLGRTFFAGWNPGAQGWPDLGASLADSSRFQQWKPRVQHTGRLNYAWRTGAWSLGYKGELMHDEILNRGMPRAPQGTTAFDEEYNTIRLDNALFAERTTENSKWNLLLAHGRFERIRNTFYKDLTTLESLIVDADGMQDTSRFNLTNGRFSYASVADSAWLNWELGLDLKHETGSGERIDRGNEQDIMDLAMYFSAEIALAEGLIARPGVRVAYNSLFDSPVTPAVNFRWKLNDRLTARMSYAQGFRAPALKELYLYFVDINHNIVGNPDLLAESSHNISSSLIHSIHKNGRTRDWEISASFNDVSDMINLAAINALEYTYVNVGQVNTFAGRVSYQERGRKYRFRVGLGTTGRSDRIPASQIETPFYLMPEGTASATVEIKDNWSVTGNYRYVGEQRNFTYVSEVELAQGVLGAYQLLDVNVSRRFFNEKLICSVGANDLLDTQNINLAGNGGGAHASGAATAPLTTGRTYFLKVQLDIE